MSVAEKSQRSPLCEEASSTTRTAWPAAASRPAASGSSCTEPLFGAAAHALRHMARSTDQATSGDAAACAAVAVASTTSATLAEPEKAARSCAPGALAHIAPVPIGEGAHAYSAK